MGIADFGSGLIGKVSKAKLTIISLDAGREKDPKKEKADKPSTGSGASPNAGVMGDAAAATAGALLNRGPADKLAKIRATGAKLLMTRNVNKYEMEVLFNPSEIRLSGYSGGNIATMKYRNQNLTGNSETGASITPASLHSELTLNLILDRTDNQAAFAADKFTLSATSIAKGIVKAGLTAAGKKNNSVQYEVEALNAAVRDPRRRLCIFTWGDMEYQGMLNSVSGEYVMFNVNGEPCRAHVRLTMTLMDGQTFSSAAGIWADHYDKGLGGKPQAPEGGAAAAAGS